jgi:gas vesicle protein
MLVVGLAAGAVIGAVVALFTAPQSGQKTREQIRAGSVQLRDRATETVDGALATLKTTVSDINTRTEGLRSQGKTVLKQAQKQVAGVVQRTGDGSGQ